MNVLAIQHLDFTSVTANKFKAVPASSFSSVQHTPASMQCHGAAVKFSMVSYQHINGDLSLFGVNSHLAAGLQAASI